VLIPGLILLVGSEQPHHLSKLHSDFNGLVSRHPVLLHENLKCALDQGWPFFSIYELRTLPARRPHTFDLIEHRDAPQFKIFALVDFEDRDAGAEITGVSASGDDVREGHKDR
jgi:hypothetical protein